VAAAGVGPERPKGIVSRFVLGYARVVDGLTEGRFQNRSLTSNRYIELQWMLFGAIFLLVLPYVLKHAINVRVDFLYTRFSPKVQAAVDFVGHIIGLIPFCVLALWVNWDYALTSLFQKGERWGTWQVWEVWEQSPDARGLPRAPIKVLVLVGFGCLLLQVLAELVKLGFVLAGRDEVAAAEEPPETPVRVE
jgi:TRAP-type mannitol/chloroaromatic compound transport system permease small subunit